MNCQLSGSVAQCRQLSSPKSIRNTPYESRFSSRPLRGPGVGVVVEHGTPKLHVGLIGEELPLAGVAEVAGEASAEGADEGEAVPVGVDERGGVVGEVVGRGVADFEVEMRAGGAGFVGVAGQGDGLTLLDGLPGLQVRCFEQVSVEGGVPVGVVNHQVVRRGAKPEIVHVGDDAIAHCDDRCATRRGKIHAEVEALPGLVEVDAVDVCAGSVAVGLPEEPGGGGGRVGEGEDEGGRVALGEGRGVGREGEEEQKGKKRKEFSRHFMEFQLSLLKTKLPFGSFFTKLGVDSGLYWFILCLS